MNTLPAQEIKRRGVKAIEIALKHGPVRIIKNNIPSCVVLKEEEYTMLVSRSEAQAQKKKKNVLQWLLQQKSLSQGKSREELDARLNAERSDWD